MMPNVMQKCANCAGLREFNALNVVGAKSANEAFTITSRNGNGIAAIAVANSLMI